MQVDDSELLKTFSEPVTDIKVQSCRQRMARGVLH